MLFIFNDICFFKHFHSSLQSVLCLDSSFDRIQSFDDDDEDEDDDDDDDDDDDGDDGGDDDDDDDGNRKDNDDGDGWRWQ